MAKAKKNKNKDHRMLHIGVLLDMSASMGRVKSATISGFNEYIETLKKDDAAGLFTLMVFNSKERREVYTDVPIKDVVELTDESYAPFGLTPLYDSIGKIVGDMSKRIGDNKDQKVLLMIMTDGEENESKEYSRDAVFKLIKEKEAEGWTVGYMGANQDSWAVANMIGVDMSNSMNYSVKDMSSAFRHMATASVSYVHSRGAQRMGLFTDIDAIGDDIDNINKIGTSKTDKDDAN